MVIRDSPITELSLKDVERIFAGEITNWSAVGGNSGKISAYTRNTSSGTYAFFQKFAMDGRDYGSSTQKMAGNEQIATEVSKNPNGIGYVGLAYVGAKGIKIVSTDKVFPSAKTANNGTYKLARGLNCFTNGKPSGMAKKFLDFSLTPEGQKIVGSTGFVPIK